MGQSRNQRGNQVMRQMKVKPQLSKIFEMQQKLRGKIIAIQVYLKKQGKSQINNLTIYLKELEE